MGPRAIFVSTFPPRRCGIATFTRDLAGAVGDHEVTAVHRAGDPVVYPMEVTGIIRHGERADYVRAADRINRAGGLVSLQHEFGIFGGRDGANVLDLLDHLEVPVVTTLHTVLRHPTPSQLDVMRGVLEHSTVAVVMSRAAAELLERIYDVSPDRVRVIHHGVPDLEFSSPATHKHDFDLQGRSVILSFGLLGPGKGYEHVIEAMPAVRRAHPAALFIVLGATHPDLVRTEGEAYRERLVRMVREFDLRDNVRFVDRYVSQQDLGRWLQAADVFVTPYPNLDQIVSGTLSYTMAAGRPIVSTPFLYATEMLSDGRGIIVEPGSAQALADALTALLGNDAQRLRIGRRAYAFARRMVWREIGRQYRSLFATVAPVSTVQEGVMAAHG